MKKAVKKYHNIGHGKVGWWMGHLLGKAAASVEQDDRLPNFQRLEYFPHIRHGEGAVDACCAHVSSNLCLETK